MSTILRCISHRQLFIFTVLSVPFLIEPAILPAAKSIEGHGRIERITGNPAMGYKELYEWDLFLVRGDGSRTGLSRRLGAMPNEPRTDDGYYHIDNLEAGSYTLYLNQPDFFASPKVIPNVQIVNGQTAYLDIILDVDFSTYFFPNTDWNEWGWDHYQTFKATGTSIRGVSWIMAGTTSGKPGVVRILEDNGNSDIRAWTLIGSGTDNSLGSNSDEWLRWPSGQIPLTPGKNYAVHIHVDGGCAIYKRDKDAHSYAYGRAYSGAGDPENYDLNITVFVDKNKQMVTHSRLYPGPGHFDGGLHDWHWGQTFVATGTSLAAVDLFAASGDADITLTWRIREGGPGGPQIGVTKTTTGAYFASSTDLIGVSYNPFDVPLVRGRTYYIEITDSIHFTPYIQESWNAFGDGRAYRNGTATNHDLAMTIMEYNYPLAPRSCNQNADDKINFLDFAPLAGQWQLSGGELTSDFNHDSLVDGYDFSTLLGHWLKVTDPDLVAHWPFDETAGVTAFDQTPNNKNGSLIGFPTDPWTAGQQGGALTFDGVDDHIEIDGYQGIAGQQSRTTAVWIKTTDSVGSIITWGLPDYGQMWMMMISSNGRLKLGVWGGYIVGTTLIRDGRWHHIAAVLENDGSPDVSEVKLYVDGQPDTISAVSPRSIDTGTQLEVQIGRMDQNHPDYYLVGSLDDVHIYQRHLSDEEIGHLAQ